MKNLRPEIDRDPIFDVKFNTICTSSALLVLPYAPHTNYVLSHDAVDKLNTGYEIPQHVRERIARLIAAKFAQRTGIIAKHVEVRARHI